MGGKTTKQHKMTPYSFSAVIQTDLKRHYLNRAKGFSLSATVFYTLLNFHYKIHFWGGTVPLKDPSELLWCTLKLCLTMSIVQAHLHAFYT